MTMPPRPRKRKPGNTWPNLDPGEGSVFEDEEADGLLMDVERKPAPKAKEGSDAEKRTARRRCDHGHRSRRGRKAP